jgi:hypothetical protein
MIRVRNCAFRSRGPMKVLGKILKFWKNAEKSICVVACSPQSTQLLSLSQHVLSMPSPLV